MKGWHYASPSYIRAYMTNLELAAIKDLLTHWWEVELPAYGDSVPTYVAALMGYVQKMDGCTFNLENGTWKYPSGVQQ